MEHLKAVHPGIREMEGYVPGEQPKDRTPVVKLNTNENPYPPPESVLQAIRTAVDGELRRYPNPSSDGVRQAAAKALDLHPDQVLVGNGSDDLLNIIMRTFVIPGETVAVPHPTYSLYRTMAAIQGANFVEVPWAAAHELPIQALLDHKPKLVFVARPNSPSGFAVTLSSVADLCQAMPQGVVVLDEAYVDFCADHGLPLLASNPNLIITRTFSKGQSLAGLRIGLGFTSTDFARELHKVRDSYNVDRLAQAAARAVLEHLSQFRPATQQIIQQRNRLTDALRTRDFHVFPSEGNFLLVQVPDSSRSAQSWKDALQKEGVLVRFFNNPDLRDKLRISIGTPGEMDTFIAKVDHILQST